MIQIVIDCFVENEKMQSKVESSGASSTHLA